MSASVAARSSSRTDSAAPRSTAPRISAVCEGLQDLDAELQNELQNFQTGFGLLLSKVKALQHVANADREEREADAKVQAEMKSHSEAPSNAPEVAERPSTKGELPVGSTKSMGRTKSIIAKGKNAPKTLGQLKLMSCWTALQTLHEETQQAANSKSKTKKNVRRSTGPTRTVSDLEDTPVKRGRSLRGVRHTLRASLAFANAMMASEAVENSDVEPWPLMKVWLPQSTARLLWNFLGLILLFYDIIVIPAELAWDLDKKGVRHQIALLAFSYWLCDFFTNFNTGYFDEGKLVLSRNKVVLHYLRTWLVPDAALITLDCMLLFSPYQDGFSLRFIRCFRLVRLIKMSKTSSLVDSMAVTTGCTAEAIIILPLMKTLVFILVGIHMMSCGWFWMGRSSFEDGEPNWLLASGTHALSPGAQYVHAFRWVLCQFTPAPNQVNPQNLRESIYCIVTILVSMVTMGASLARISGALTQLNAMKFARERRLRELRLYLLEQSVTSELANRILTFADYSLQHNDTKEGIAMDFSLVSVKLRQELIMHLNGDTLCLHPLMHLILRAFSDVFMRVCESITERVYEEGETVFRAGSSAQCMYVITNGDFLVQLPTSTGDIQETKATARQWFSDIALFTNVLHVETLQSKKFGKICMLEGVRFAQLLQGSPACADVVLDYASRYLQSLRGDTLLTSDVLRSRSQEACENTQAFRWYSGKLRLASIDYVRCEHGDDDMKGPDFLRLVMEGSMQLEEALPRFADLFPELDANESRVYSRFRGDVERFRAGASILSVLCLVTNRYDLFTIPQNDENRMTRDLWEEMQLFVRWANLSAEAIHSLCVFLVIRGAGKVKSLVDQLPLDPTDSPETAIRYMMENLSGLLPSCATLNEESHDLLVFLLEVQQEFHIAQFMQGENSAFSVARLQEYVEDRPAHYYPAYLLGFVGIMSGIAGGEYWEREIGSRFMTQNNTATIVEVLRALQKIDTESPHDVYWGYVQARARRLEVPAPLSSDDSAHRVLARLLCLYRAQDLDSRQLVENALKTMDESDNRIMVGHLLADGFVGQPSYVLAFLPACLANAQSNPAVGLPRCLAKLAEVYGMLDARRCLEVAGGGNVKVDLSEFSRFIAQVRSATVFNQCVEHMKIRGSTDCLFLSMSNKNWNRVHDDDAAEYSAFQSLRQILNQQEIMKEILEQLVSKTEAVARRATTSGSKSHTSVISV